jgi:hypothetical protein
VAGVLIIPEAEEGFDDILRAIVAYSIEILSIFIFGGGKNSILGVFSQVYSFIFETGVFS